MRRAEPRKTPIAGGLRLAQASLQALGRIGADAFAEAGGRALPRTREQICDTETLNRLLVDDCPTGGLRLPIVSDVRLPGIDFESSNCTNFLLEVEFVDGGSRADLPRTLYVKIPCPEMATRVFGNALGFWELETRFCTHVAPHMPIRTPRVYAAARKGARFVLVLEDLGEASDVELFTNREMARGTTVARARLVLKTFARLHAHFLGRSLSDRERILPAAYNTYTARRWRSLTHALNVMSLAPAHRAAPELITEHIVDTCQLALRRWDDVLRAWYQGPLTLVHGDSHLGNCFEYLDEGAARVGMIDFQAVHWSKGMRDVQYFLINSLEPDLLEASEDDLIRFYCDQLAENGVELSLAEAHEQYRAFTYQTLMVGVVPLGLGSLTERDATVQTIAARSARAVERLGFREWVEALP